MISCILLSAGSSQRYGSPKALAKIYQEPVICYILERLISSSVGEIIVVLGDRADVIKSYILKHKKVKVVYNKDHKLGQTSSFQAGLRIVSDEASGIMLLPVDIPCVLDKTVNHLCGYFLKTKPSVLIPTYQGQKGHPPLFSCDHKSALLNIDPQMGLNAYQREHAEDIELYPVSDEGILKTFNTREEFETVKSFIQKQSHQQ